MVIVGVARRVALEKEVLGLFRGWDKHPKLRSLLIQLRPSLKDLWPLLLDKLTRYYWVRSRLILAGELTLDPWDLAAILGMAAAGVTLGHFLLSIGRHIARHIGFIGPSKEEILEKKLDALAVALGVEDKYGELLKKEKILRLEVIVVEKPIIYQKKRV